MLVEAALKPGLHRFSLVVVRADGRASRPDEAIVQVQDPIRIDILRPPIGVLRPQLGGVVPPRIVTRRPT